MTRTELVERQQAYRAAQGRAALIFLFPVIITPLGMIPYHSLDIDRWGYWPEVVASVVLASLLAALTIVAPRLRERQVRKMGLACPSCGEALISMTGRIAAVTGRCGNCGHRIVDPD
jgi:predicted RNA-binding Zn-ribbon protein involved in translation (DUF1610 family)